MDEVKEAKSQCPHDWKIEDTQLPRGAGPVFNLRCRRCHSQRDAHGIDELHRINGLTPTEIKQR